MLDMKRTQFLRNEEAGIASGATIAYEGLPLIGQIESGELVVQTGTGGAGEKFYGFSIRADQAVATQPKVENGTIPAAPGPYTVSLTRTNLVHAFPVTSVRVYDVALAADFTLVAGAPAATQCQVNGTTGVLTFNNADAGKAIVVYYRYNLTVAEAQQMFHDRAINNLQLNEYITSMTVGIGPGRVFVDLFHSEDTYGTAGDPITVYLQSDGLPGTTVTNVTLGSVIHAPTIDNPYLGIYIEAPQL